MPKKPKPRDFGVKLDSKEGQISEQNKSLYLLVWLQQLRGLKNPKAAKKTPMHACRGCGYSALWGVHTPELAARRSSTRRMKCIYSETNMKQIYF